MHDVSRDVCRPDPSVLFNALGGEILIHRAREGDRDAQWSQGYRLMSEAEGADTPLGAAGRSPKANAGLTRCTAQFPVAHNTEMRCVANS